MKKVFAPLIAVVALSGCGEKVYDAAYYQANHEKAQDMIKKCEAGEVTGDNCTNAKAGFDKYKAQAFKDYMLGKTKERPNFN